MAALLLVGSSAFAQEAEAPEVPDAAESENTPATEDDTSRTESDADGDGADSVSSEEASADETSADETSADETSADETSADEMGAEEAIGEAISTEQPSNSDDEAAEEDAESSDDDEFTPSADRELPTYPSTLPEIETRESRFAPHVALHGELRFRLTGMSDIPLHTESRTGFDDELGQNLFATSWLRLSGEVGFGRELKLVGQIDLLDGVLFGDETNGVDNAIRPRNDATAFTSDGVDARWLYLEWLSKIGLIRAGLVPSHWGLGLIGNDGTHEPPFGDYRYGNSSIRLMYATRPLGRDVPLNLVLAADLVYRDPLADLTEGDRALQAIMALFYGDQSANSIGAYVVRRSGRRSPAPGVPDDELNIWAMDFFASARFDDPTGKGEIVMGFEGLHIRGTTSYARTVDRAEDDVRQTMAAFQIGRESQHFDVFLEGGYTSGDSNTEDGVQRRATMHPDHRIGLILFPELVAWQTARTSTLAGNEELVGRPPPGSDLLATDGGVTGAAYLFNWWKVRPTKWMDLNVGWIWARATADIVDPFRQRSQSRSVGYLGGDSANRGLGFELDGSVMFHHELKYGFTVQGGLEGGVLFPGNAFDDATGLGLDPIMMIRGRFAFIF
ncbi:MAG: hypothetical protein AAF645_07465 [Myxococcota bacterium]